jgi:gliding motility-associated lipoprotein GldD
MFSNCGESYTPKPRGFFRIDFPEKLYTKFDSTFPYVFEYPVICKINLYKNDSFQEPYWINIDYPMFKGTLFLSYKRIKNNLPAYVSDSWEFVNKHIPKADAIIPTPISFNENKVFGLLFSIHGSGAASPSQFYVTDSITHFLRGALYFDVVPNNDSLQPVIDYINTDIEHFLKTLKWN